MRTAALGGIAGERLLRLTTRGRRSGLPRVVTIWFAVDGDAIVLGTLNDDRQWVRNARREPVVELEVGPLRLRGRLHDVADPQEHARVRGLMARKYWPARIASWFGVGQRFTFRVDQLVEVAPGGA
jgi:deazaflavin-dependent oxidoreductase (nitroreductase family)